MSAIRHEPDMNIVNQINAALNDIRTTLVTFATEIGEHQTISIGGRIHAIQEKAKYQLEIAMDMVEDHVLGHKSIPWSEMRGMVEEEFS